MENSTQTQEQICSDADLKAAQDMTMDEMTLKFLFPSGESMKIIVPRATKVALMAHARETENSPTDTGNDAETNDSRPENEVNTQNDAEENDSRPESEADPGENQEEDPESEGSDVEEPDGGYNSEGLSSEGAADGGYNSEGPSLDDAEPGELLEEELSEAEWRAELDSCSVEPGSSNERDLTSPLPTITTPTAPVMTSLDGKLMAITAYLFGLQEGRILPPFDKRKKMEADVWQIYVKLQEELEEKIGLDWQEHAIIKEETDPVQAHQARRAMYTCEGMESQPVGDRKLRILDMWKAMGEIGMKLREARGRACKMYTNAVDIDRWSELQICYKLTTGPFDGHEINVVLDIPEDYPLSPVIARTTRTVYHPQIHHITGEILLEEIRDWQPDYSIQSILLNVLRCLQRPKYEDAINPMYTGTPYWDGMVDTHYQRRRLDHAMARVFKTGLHDGRMYGGLTSLPRELQDKLPCPQHLDSGEVMGVTLYQIVLKPKPKVPNYTRKRAHQCQPELPENKKSKAKIIPNQKSM